MATAENKIILPRESQSASDTKIGTSLPASDTKVCTHIDENEVSSWLENTAEETANKLIEAQLSKAEKYYFLLKKIFPYGQSSSSLDGLKLHEDSKKSIAALIALAINSDIKNNVKTALEAEISDATIGKNSGRNMRIQLGHLAEIADTDKVPVELTSDMINTINEFRMLLSNQTSSDAVS